MNIKKIIGLLGFLGLACTPAPKWAKDYEPERKGQEVFKYKGETTDYDVEASETGYGDLCIERIIILRAKNMLHTNPNVVDYVWARDRDCNEDIDEWRFRGVRLRSVNKFILETDVLHAFYRAKYDR